MYHNNLDNSFDGMSCADLVSTYFECKISSSSLFFPGPKAH